MQDTFPKRNGPPSGGFVTIGTMLLSAVSAVLLVLLSGCHSAPSASGFVSSASDKGAEERLQRPVAMAPLQPFDEQFVVVTDDTN